MRPRVPLIFLVTWACFGIASQRPVEAQQAPAPQVVAGSEARTPLEEKAGFHLPEGFEIELVASEPQINKPMNIAFDDRGRLWVTSTVEYPYAVPDGKVGRDRVVILGDFADNGQARTVSTFADGLNIPIGVLPIGRGDSALVHSIPNILRLTDTDGDGKADRSAVAYEKYGFRDTHGMTNAFTWGFDGWVYACHGFSNESRVAGADNKSIVMQSGNVYRMKPDGSHLELFSQGQVNPFGLAFDPLGHLYSCDCHSKPIYQNLRGACYPSFGKPDDGLGFGPEMIRHDHGSTGIGGIAYYASDHFPVAYRDTTFIGNVVTSRINHDKLEWTGSTPRAIEQPDFLTSDDPWFRPVDIELGPDGALYVADFYNRIIGHYEVPLNHPGRDRERGRIWRIVYKGKDGTSPPPKDPRKDASAASIAELIEDLEHPNLAVRTRASNQLVERGKPAIEPVKAAVVAVGSPWRTVHGLWVLHRLGALDDATHASVSSSQNESIRVHAMKVAGDRPSLNDSSRIILDQGLKDSSAQVRRAAVEALALYPDADKLMDLLAVLRSVDPADTHLKHAARIALRNQFGSSVKWARLETMTLSEADQALIADVALGVPSPEAAHFLLDRLFLDVGYFDRVKPKPNPDPLDLQIRFARHVARHGDADNQETLASVAGKVSPGSAQIAMLKAIHQGTQERGGMLSANFRKMAADLVQTLINSANPNDRKSAIELAGSMKLEGTKPALLALVANPKGATTTRGPAMTALVAIDPSGSIPTLARVVRDSSEPMDARELAATLLVGSGKDEARGILVEAMATAPARLQATIATGLALSRPGAEALLQAVAAGKASARPLQERGVVVRLEASQVPDLKARLELLLKDLPPAEARVQTLIEKRRAGFLATSSSVDTSKGSAIFARVCASCHQIEGKGARVGPQLDGVGLRGLDRLLEDTLDPNRNVDQAFRVTTLALKDGRVVSGLLLRQDGEVLVLADAQGQEVRVDASTVEDRKLSQLSPMPANLADQIEEADFSNLLAYLLGNVLEAHSHSKRRRPPWSGWPSHQEDRLCRLGSRPQPKPVVSGSHALAAGSWPLIQSPSSFW